MPARRTETAYPLGMAIDAMLRRGYSKQTIAKTCHVSWSTITYLVKAYENEDHEACVSKATKSRLSSLVRLAQEPPRGSAPISQRMRLELETFVARLRDSGMTSSHIAKTCHIDIETVALRNKYVTNDTYNAIMRKAADLEFDAANGFGTRSQTMKVAAAHEKRPRDQRQRKVIRYLHENPDKSLRAAARACGVSHACAQRAIRKHGDPRRKAGR